MTSLRRGAVRVVGACAAAALVVMPTSAAHAQGADPSPGTYTIAQATSDRAQSMTIAFDALGFLTGDLATDSFFPPGKVADFWGFQALRDNDPSRMGHSTDFLTSAALNALSILTADQRAQLVALASTQVDAINLYAMDRFVLMTAFRRLLSGDVPAGTTLSRKAVRAFSAELYRQDAAITLQRAAVMGPILQALTPGQRAQFDAMVGQGMSSWPKASEPTDLRGLDHDTKVAVMTYAGDLFSWYAGSIEDDVYFCPERHGTYFGSFFLKDAPAVGQPGYSISTSVTGDMGAALLGILTPAQGRLISALVDKQRSTLSDIVSVRRGVGEQLRRYRSGGTADTATVMSLMERYGSDDGAISYAYAEAFAAVDRTMTPVQRAALTKLRESMVGSVKAAPAYLFAQPVSAPAVRSTDFLFTRTSRKAATNP